MNMSSDKEEFQPHKWLSDIASGNSVLQKKWSVKYYSFGPRAGQIKSKELIEEEIYPSFQERLEAAKVAAPYFSPKLSTQKIQEEKVNVIFQDDFGDNLE